MGISVFRSSPQIKAFLLSWWTRIRENVTSSETPLKIFSGWKSSCYESLKPFGFFSHLRNRPHISPFPAHLLWCSPARSRPLGPGPMSQGLSGNHQVINDSMVVVPCYYTSAKRNSWDRNPKNWWEFVDKYFSDFPKGAFFWGSSRQFLGVKGLFLVHFLWESSVNRTWFRWYMLILLMLQKYLAPVWYFIPLFTMFLDILPLV